MRKGRVIALSLGVLAAAFGLFTWHTVNTPRSDPRVTYEPADVTCSARGTGDAEFRYCIYRAKQGTDGRVAYHLHGRNLDERAWNDDTYYTGMIQARWAETGVRPPIVVSVSFGKVWLLAARGKAPRSGLLEVFRSQVLPAVEAETGVPRGRVVFGESMGGVNALAAGMALPGVFERAISLCPPLYEASPFADWDTTWAALEHTGAEPKLALALRRLVPEFFADDAEWRAFSPLSRAETAAPSGAPTLYVSVGLYDAYGSYVGVERFVSTARARGWRVEWRPLYGGHCAIDVASVARNLADAPPSPGDDRP